MFLLSSISISDITNFIITIQIHILTPYYVGQNPIEYQFYLNRFSEEKNNIQVFTIRAYNHQPFMRLFNYDLRIVITNLELDPQFQLLYNMNVFYGKYADSDNQPNIDFENIIPDYTIPPMVYEAFPNYITNIIEIEEVSSCSPQYQIDLICNKDLNISETKLNMTFIGKSGSMYSECLVYPKTANKIVCQFYDDAINSNSIVESYLNMNDKELYFIYLKDNYTFPIKCMEKPPIRAIIGITVIFLFIIIMITLFIILVNKAQKRVEYGYEILQKSVQKNNLEFY